MPQVERDIQELIKRREGATSFLDFAFKFPKGHAHKSFDFATGGNS